MHEIRTEIDIAASPDRVWQVLMDFPSHPDWNPFVRSIQGKPRVGEQLVVKIQPEGGKGMTLKPKVLVADPQKELRWLGHLLFKGVFDGEHFFQVQAMANGHTRLVHGERFSGLLVPLAKSALDGGTKAGFIAMNEALKSRAETPA
jgi:hypothetical protein